MTLTVNELAFDAGAEEVTFRTGLPLDCGAVASFVGLMRGEGGGARSLTLEHYPGYTEKVIAAHMTSAAERFGLLRLRVRHRVGRILPGEAIVFVATAARHRRAAFEACEYVMDHLKSDAPFWKKEEGPAGPRWIEPTDADLADRRRWEENDDAGH